MFHTLFLLNSKMEELYGLHCTSVSDYSMLLVPDTDRNYNTNIINMVPPPPIITNNTNSNNYLGGFPTSFQAMFGTFSGAEQLLSGNSSAVSDAASMVQQKGSSEEEVSSAIRAKIASHPLYPNLLRAYIDCQKVGAPPEMACILEEIRRENEFSRRSTVANLSCMGVDPELDEFMETYCDILVRYKTDLSRPFDEATTFLNDIQAQFNSLCNGSSTTTTTHVSDEIGSSDEDGSGGDVDFVRTNEDHELKDRLLRKYSGYISSLKHEFTKKKKKGKLPKDSRQVLLNWWNVHYKWPYPTEGDKIALADATGLDQKQINNWFINQRKRHWKPTENMQFAVVDSLYGSVFMND